MSIRLIDEIYAALHNGESPPYTNARKAYYTTNINHFFFVDENTIETLDLTPKSSLMIIDDLAHNPYKDVEQEKLLDYWIKKIFDKNLKFLPPNGSSEPPSSQSDSQKAD